MRVYFNWKILILSIVIYIINIIIILQLIPVFESSDLGSKIINLLVFSANFFFEDLLRITGIKIIDILTWIFQFVYIYLISAIIIYFMKGGKKK